MSLTTFNRMRRRLAEIKKEKEIDLTKLNFNDLRLLAKDMGMSGYGNLKKEELIKSIIEEDKRQKGKKTESDSDIEEDKENKEESAEEK